MKAARSKEKWKLDDSGVTVYHTYLQAGDFIVAKHPVRMDRKKQASRAEVMLVTTKKIEADKLVKNLEERATVSKENSQKLNSKFNHSIITILRVLFVAQLFSRLCDRENPRRKLQLRFLLLRSRMRNSS